MKKNIFVLLLIFSVFLSMSIISANDLNGDMTLNDNDNSKIKNNYPLTLMEDNSDDLSKTVYGNDIVKIFRNDTQYEATFKDSEGNYLKNGTVVRFEINDVSYDRQVGENGLAKLNINLIQGQYTINATNLLTNESITNSITVLSRLVENNQLTKMYKSDEAYSVKVLDDYGNPVGKGTEVKFNIDGIFYTAETNEQGIANLNIDFAPGGYLVTAQYLGCEVCNYIRVLPILVARDLSMKYRDGSQFIATLYDNQNKPLSNGTVKFTVNGVSYYRITDEIGQAKLNINLDENVYSITSSYGDMEISNKINITANNKIPNLLSGDKLGTYEELINKFEHLSPGDVLILDKDYAFENTGREMFQIVNGKVAVLERYIRGIDININNITVDGNGHSIDGKSKAAIFNVLADNVTIKNLNFINGHDVSNFRAGSQFLNMNYTESSLRWSGNYGTVSNCKFTNNMGFIGGAISWTGNNGTICDSIFINNTARGVGGAIYVNASNHRILNSMFRNCHSLLTGEILYYDPMRGNCTLSSVDFGNGTYIDGITTNIDLKYLYQAYSSNVADDFYNLINVAFLSLNYNGKTLFLDENTTVKSSYNTTDYFLTFNKKLGNNVILSKDYCFSNITHCNDIFDALLKSNFKNKFILIKNFHIDDSDIKKSYDEARTLKSNVLLPYIKYCEGASGSNLSLVLNVEFRSFMFIQSNDAWVIKDSGFNIVSIQGNRATISSTSKDRDEYTWAIVDSNCIFTVNHLLIEKFNTAIENKGGYCILNHVTFYSNKKDYLIDADYGAAILNTGLCVCSYCAFDDNYAKHGGAIFNQGTLNLDNCTFFNNYAYGKGQDVCNANGGVLTINGEKYTGNDKYITNVEKISSGWKIFLTIINFGLSFAIGFAAGFITANPVTGAAVGAAVGAGLGLGTASIIITLSYNPNMNRIGYALTLSITTAALGAAGGIIGAYFAMPDIIYTVDSSAVNPNINPEIAGFINVEGSVTGYNGVDLSVLSFTEF